MVEVGFGGHSEDDSFQYDDFGLSGFGGGGVFSSSLGKEEGANNEVVGNGWDCVAEFDRSSSAGFERFLQQSGGDSFFLLWGGVDIVVRLE
jgi:hypothetical protein